jgi:uncharacterized protein
VGGVHLNLENLALRGGQRHECAYAIALSPLSFGGVEYQLLLPEGVTVSVERVAGGFLLRLTADAKACGPCSRCLADVEIDLRAEQEEFAPTAAGGWAESQFTPFIEGTVVDLSGLAREAVVLAMPERVLCSAACKGLCTRCGVDLNRGRCECANP